MASIVEFLVKIKDMASGPFGKIAAAGKNSFSSLERNVNSFSAKFNRLGMSIQDIDKKLDQLRRTREISVDSRQVRRANQEISELERRKARLEGNGSGGGFGRLIGTSLAMAGIAGGLGIAGGIAGAGMQREATNMRFEVMAGKEQGGALSKNLINFAEKSIYGNEVFQDAQTMMAFGIGAKDVMPNLKMLGDVAMGDVNRLKMLTLAFSQVRAGGKLTGQDLLQFVNAGFNPLQEIAAKTGKSLATLKDEVSDGKISFQAVAGAFARATGAGGRFYQMTEKLNKTAFGQWQALKGSVEGLAASLGTKLLPVISELVGWGQFLVDNTHWVYGMAAAWGAYALSVKLAAFATSGLTITQWLFNIAAAANPWGLLIAGLVLLATWLHHVVQKYGGWLVVLDASWQTVKSFAVNIKTAFLDAFQEISYWVEMGILRVKQFKQFLAGGSKTATVQITALEINREKQRKQNMAEMAEASQNSSYAWDRVMWNKKTGKSADKIAGASAGAGANGLGGVPASMEDTNKGITGGGVRNLTINLGKFLDNITIQTTNLEAGVDEIEEKITEMFLRITNSGQSMASN